MDISEYLESKKTEVNAALKRYIGKADFPLAEKVYEAIRYSLLSGGKRIRPILAIASAELFGMPGEKVMPAACALEFIHTYSLIHDDLPCMDDDDLRRGKPTSHIVFGEAVATLAGDALLTAAFELMSANAEIAGISPERVVRIIGEVSKAAGAGGMIGGQMVDISLSGKNEVSLEMINYLHSHKTGSLIAVSAKTGAILAGADEDDLKRVDQYGRSLGLAFQIVDDVLDETGDEKILGKPIGSDKKKNKITYVSKFGIEESKRRALELTEKAKDALKIYGKSAFYLLGIADFLVSRYY